MQAAQRSEDAKKARAESKRRIVMVSGSQSGYGKTMVPVLKSNNYELNTGERSVFDQEYAGAGGARCWKCAACAFE